MQRFHSILYKWTQSTLANFIKVYRSNQWEFHSKLLKHTMELVLGMIKTLKLYQNSFQTLTICTKQIQIWLEELPIITWWGKARSQLIQKVTCKSHSLWILVENLKVLWSKWVMQDRWTVMLLKSMIGPEDLICMHSRMAQLPLVNSWLMIGQLVRVSSKWKVAPKAQTCSKLTIEAWDPTNPTIHTHYKEIQLAVTNSKFSLVPTPQANSW